MHCPSFLHLVLRAALPSVDPSLNRNNAILGVLTSGVAMWVIASYGNMHALMYSCVTVVTCFVGGYLFSLITSDKPKNPQGLTIHTSRTAPAVGDSPAISYGGVAGP